MQPIFVNGVRKTVSEREPYDDGSHIAQICFKILKWNLRAGSAEATRIRFVISARDWEFSIKLLTDLNWINIEGDQIEAAENKDLEVFLFVTEYTQAFQNYMELQLKRMYGWDDQWASPLAYAEWQKFFSTGDGNA